jgi:hypothetical protein
MGDFLGATGKGLQKVLTSIGLYIAGSVFVMILTSYLMTGKFPPPIFETIKQVKSLSGLSNSGQQNEISDQLANMRNHNQELENAFNMAGGHHVPEPVGTQPNKAPAAVTPPPAEVNEEIQRMRFELVVLKTQMLFSRQEIERLKVQIAQRSLRSPVQVDMRAAAYRQKPVKKSAQKPRSK